MDINGFVVGVISFAAAVMVVAVMTIMIDDIESTVEIRPNSTSEDFSITMQAGTDNATFLSAPISPGSEVVII